MRLWAAFFFLFLFSNTAIPTEISKKEIHFVLLYPNGEGDPESAKAYLVPLFERLSQKSELTITGQYINDAKLVEEVLAKQSSQIALVGTDTFEDWFGKSKVQILARTLLPNSQQAIEHFYFLQHAKASPTNSPVFSARPYSPEFLQKICPTSQEFCKKKITLKVTPEITAELMQAAQGDQKITLLLTEYEYAVVKNLQTSMPLFKNLKVSCQSPALPSSPVIVLNSSGITPVQIAKLQQTLIDFGKTVEEKEILSNLRLSGFAKDP